MSHENLPPKQQGCIHASQTRQLHPRAYLKTSPIFRSCIISRVSRQATMRNKVPLSLSHARLFPHPTPRHICMSEYFLDSFHRNRAVDMQLTFSSHIQNALLKKTGSPIAFSHFRQPHAHTYVGETYMVSCQIYNTHLPNDQSHVSLLPNSHTSRRQHKFMVGASTRMCVDGLLSIQKTCTPRMDTHPHPHTRSFVPRHHTFVMARCEMPLHRSVFLCATCSFPVACTQHKAPLCMRGIILFTVT